MPLLGQIRAATAGHVIVERTQHERDVGAHPEREHGDGETRAGGMGDENSPYGAGTESPSHTLSANRCSATNRFGQPCKARAIERGLCAMHSGKTDPRKLGVKGGSSQESALRKAARTDAEIIEKAKGALVDQLDGKDEKRRFEAAALFSFRPQAPPAEHQGQEPREHIGRGFNITDLIRWSCEAGTLHQLGKDGEAQAELRKIEARVVELLPVGSTADYGSEAA